MTQSADRQVQVSNREKAYFPSSGITKGEVVDYYERIAEFMVPHVRGRPIVLQRFPDGIDSSGFFQKNVPSHAPDWLARVEVPTADGSSTLYAVVEDAAGLVFLANYGTIAFHTLLADAGAPLRPVEVIFDLDPSGDDVGPVRRAAAALREVLDELAMAPRVKTTGSRGLHVVVEVTDEQADFDLTKAFSRRVAALVAERGPFTLEQRKAKRDGRLFLDVLRNAAANHAVAPYSLRPLPDAPVAAPLSWDEALAASFDPRRITIKNIFRRLGQVGDPWSQIGPPKRTIAEALEALGERAG